VSAAPELAVAVPARLGAPAPHAAAPATRVASGILWATAGALFSQGSVLLSSIAAARLLGHEGFGELAIVQSTVAMLGGLAGMGLGTTATRFVAETSERDPARTGRILGLATVATAVTGLFFAVVLAAGAPAAARLFHAPAIAPQLRLGSLYVLFFTLNTFQVGALAGFSAFPALARIGFVQGLLGAALLALGAWSFGLTGAALALGLAAIASWAHHQRALHRECARHAIRISWRGATRELEVLGGFALPAALSGVLGGLATTAATALLARQEGGLREVATFNAANAIRIVVLFMPALVTRVSTPLLVRLRGARDAAGYRRTFSRFLAGNTAFAGAAAAALFALGPWLLALWGRGFPAGRGALGLLLAAAVAETLAVALFQTLYSHGRIWLHLAIMALWSALLVGATAWWGPAHGASGLAAAYLVAWAVATTLYGWAARVILREDAT
jgi:O-antigen/teichoic acid export membrane protein